MPYALRSAAFWRSARRSKRPRNCCAETERSTILSLAICDRQNAGVLEITPKNVVLRHGSDGICVNTNHFRSETLCVWKVCPRYTVLSKAAAMEKIGVADVFKKLDEVNMGPLTVQSMVFEPGPLVLHLAMGSARRRRNHWKKWNSSRFSSPRHDQYDVPLAATRRIG